MVALFNPTSKISTELFPLQGSYTVNRYTIMKLKRSSMYSVESNILDSRGFYVFRKSGEEIRQKSHKQEKNLLRWNSWTAF
jgi:hypothetical protein